MYDSTLDPISPDFDPASWGPQEVLDMPTNRVGPNPFVSPDEPAIVDSPDREQERRDRMVDELIAFHTTTEGATRYNRIPVSIGMVERMTRGGKARSVSVPSDLAVRMLRVRLTSLAHLRRA